MKTNETCYDEGDIIFTEQIGKRIRRIRRQKGINQSELADIVNMTQPSISQIERGRRKQVKVSTLARIAEALDTTVDYFITSQVGLPLDKISDNLRHTVERLASFPESQQEEINAAMQWLIEWRYNTSASSGEGQ